MPCSGSVAPSCTARTAPPRGARLAPLALSPQTPCDCSLLRSAHLPRTSLHLYLRNPLHISYHFPARPARPASYTGDAAHRRSVVWRRRRLTRTNYAALPGRTSATVAIPARRHTRTQTQRDTTAQGGHSDGDGDGDSASAVSAERGQTKRRGRNWGNVQTQRGRRAGRRLCGEARARGANDGRPPRADSTGRLTRRRPRDARRGPRGRSERRGRGRGETKGRCNRQP